MHVSLSFSILYACVFMCLERVCVWCSVEKKEKEKEKPRRNIKWPCRHSEMTISHDYYC